MSRREIARPDPEGRGETTVKWRQFRISVIDLSSHTARQASTHESALSSQSTNEERMQIKHTR